MTSANTGPSATLAPTSTSQDQWADISCRVPVLARVTNVGSLADQQLPTVDVEKQVDKEQTTELPKSLFIIIIIVDILLTWPK